ncbi:PAS domain-containing sensor histidine kinase, partial [Burkholderia cenocepacia]|nr:PAS domain-containing sensor histidine kinase [Burkholderia cenocepacia]
LTALLLLVLLAAASANTEFFDRYYSWLYATNIVVALVFLLVVLGLIGMIVVRLRKGKFGTRLLAKLAVFFALVGVVPGGIIYIVSYQFVSRSRSSVSVVPFVFASTLASWSDISRAFVCRSDSDASSIPRPRFRPAVSAVSTFTSNHDSILRDTNW